MWRVIIPSVPLSVPMLFDTGTTFMTLEGLCGSLYLILPLVTYEARVLNSI